MNREIRPPRLAEKLLLAFLKDELTEEVLGDLDEKFYTDLNKKTVRKAKLAYWLQVINYMRPFAIKFFQINSTFSIMFKHNFLVSLRHIIKNRTFSTINIGGLALGMTVAILISLWIHDEFNYNKYHKNYDRLVQLMRVDKEAGITYVNSSLVTGLGPYLADNYPATFESITMTFFREREQLLTANKTAFDQIGYFFMPDAIEMFSINVINGDPNGIEQPTGIMISEGLSRKLFGDRDPIGKMINLNTQQDLVVTSVYKDLPTNSVFKNAGFIASLELYYNENRPPVWDNYNIRVYGLLNEGVSVDEASASVKDVMQLHRDEDQEPMELFAMPMKDWHLNANFVNGVKVTSERLQFIRLYGIIGVFVLILAFINFVNLNTAKYQNRGREVGVRKSLGSLKSQLVNQFFVESILYSFLALLLSLVLAILLLPTFNILSAKSMVMPFDSIEFWLAITGFCIFSGMVAGAYPSFYLASFNPIKALKGTINQGKTSINLRQALVVFQFAISIILIIGTITVYMQIQSGKSRPVGYNKSNLLSVRLWSDDYYEKFDLLRSELLATGVVSEVATANYPLMTTLGNNGGFHFAETGERIDQTFNTIYVSPEYGKTTEWQLLAGRDFMREGTNELNSIIISRLAAKAMGLENPVGTQITSSREFKGQTTFNIVGMIEDMVKGSPFQSAMPLMLFPTPFAQRYTFIRIERGVDLNSALIAMQDVFDNLLPNEPFNYQFVDDQYLTKFQPEERIGNLAAIFSLMAVLISCLGIFGLSAYMVEKKTKEIGIRKVLGASVFNLWNMLSRSFGLLVLIAFVVAVPVAWYFLDAWLQNYEYRIPIHWWVFALAAVLTLVVTIITVSYNSIRASIVNPINSLRSE